ncbi:hypothetical protein [Jiella marina]|uniref:hypothetical protein n=1 Tax=Jiella sp. LLJ827 TaxID=2917712 RepID=UPI0021017A11|nr:hypothetical protein [Jiella sp. LLJ827]MCQ0987367.1 hypothetical protein [Jiella sp. LLJ827]
MTDSERAQKRANAVFGQQPDRHEKGSAMGLIRADAAAVQEKTARLRAARLAREEAAVAEEPAPKKTRARRTKVKATA